MINVNDLIEGEKYEYEGKIYYMIGTTLGSKHIHLSENGTNTNIIIPTTKISNNKRIIKLLKKI